jgi:hypothetical protein
VELKALVGAVALALGGATMSVAPAEAVQIRGQLDITGVVNVQTSDFAPGGALDFDQGNAFNQVVIATGDFSSIALGTSPTLFDLDFTAPETVYTVDGFTFTATSFFDFDNAFPGRGFAANGILSGAGFDDTPGVLAFSTQATSSGQVLASFSSSTTAIPLPASVLMLLAALGGLGIVSRGRSATV